MYRCRTYGKPMVRSGNHLRRLRGRRSMANVEPELQMFQPTASRTGLSTSQRGQPRSGMTARFMTKETQVRTSAVLLALATVAVVVFAWINVQKESEYVTP